MRRKLVRGAQWGAVVVLLAFVTIRLSQQWNELWPQVRGRLASLDIHWGMIALASLLVLVTYAALIETWRQVLAAWNRKLGWMTAARIWFTSGLAKYIPGNIWSLAAMGAMAREQGASSVAAAGSSILITILNLASGFAIVLLCGSNLVPNRVVVTVVTVLVIAAAGAAPMFLPRLARLAGRITGREIPIPTVPATAVWLSLLGTAAAWVTYGIAFYLFSRALLGAGTVGDSIVRYIAAYAFAYIAGFVTPTPAGLVVRELFIAKGLAVLGVMSYADGWIVALTSRIWLTVLEVVPGLVGLAASHVRTRTRHA